MGSHRSQKAGYIKRLCDYALCTTLSQFLSVAATVITFLAPRCEVWTSDNLHDLPSKSAISFFNLQLCYVLGKKVQSYLKLCWAGLKEARVEKSYVRLQYLLTWLSGRKSGPDPLVFYKFTWDLPSNALVLPKIFSSLWFYAKLLTHVNKALFKIASCDTL